jgi:hypothetical protein
VNLDEAIFFHGGLEKNFGDSSRVGRKMKRIVFGKGRESV